MKKYIIHSPITRNYHHSDFMKLESYYTELCILLVHLTLYFDYHPIPYFSNIHFNGCIVFCCLFFFKVKLIHSFYWHFGFPSFSLSLCIDCFCTLNLYLHVLVFLQYILKTIFQNLSTNVYLHQKSIGPIFTLAIWSNFLKAFTS